MAWHDDPNNAPGILTTVLASDANNVSSLTANVVGVVIQSLSAIVTGIVLSFVASWHLALLSLAIAPLIIFAGIINASLAAENTFESKELGESAKIFTEVINNIKTVATLGREKIFLQRYAALLPAVRKAAIKRGSISGIFLGLSNFIMFGFFALVFYVGALLVTKQGLGVMDMFLGMFALAFGAFDLGASQQLMPDVGKAVASSRTLFKYLDMKSTIDPEDPNLTLTEPIKGNIEFRHVTFKYPNRDQPVFNKVSFKIPGGRKVALVGPSGCGKSTVFQLLLRFYDTDEGHIFIDGHDIKHYNLKHLRQQFSIVSQEPVLFNGTIEYNIK